MMVNDCPSPSAPVGTAIDSAAPARMVTLPVTSRRSELAGGARSTCVDPPIDADCVCSVPIACGSPQHGNFVPRNRLVLMVIGPVVPSPLRAPTIDALGSEP